jgi:NADH dehydrogenase/NADH:ubiquinone oxidoreductase subunit G
MSEETTTISVTINGREVGIPPGTTLLKAAREAGFSIPSLCDYELLAPIGACRMCLVEVEGMQRLQTACTLLPANGMEVTTESEVLTKARRDVLELLFRALHRGKTTHPVELRGSPPGDQHGAVHRVRAVRQDV